MAPNNTLSKTSIISLYKRCIRSVQQMPDFNQRGAYLIYVRDSFHKTSHLPNSREALMAYRDGLDQVEQMEYYHSQMKIKQNERQQSFSVNETQPSVVSNSNTSDQEEDELDTRQQQYGDATCNIQEWLLQLLPHLNEEDATNYSKHLVDDGFDSIPFMKEELLVEDLYFMKKAHRRVIERTLKEWREGEDDDGR